MIKEWYFSAPCHQRKMKNVMDVENAHQRTQSDKIDIPSSDEPIENRFKKIERDLQLLSTKLSDNISSTTQNFEDQKGMISFFSKGLNKIRDTFIDNICLQVSSVILLIIGIWIS
jgi:hypothetical protein